RTEEETPITPPKVKIPVLTQGGPSNVKGTSTGVEGQRPTKTSLSLGRKVREVTKQGTRPPPHVEEQTLTITRSEMQRMIAEAVAAQLKQTQVEQPRVEQPQIEKPPPEREQQAQSNERQNMRVDEEESSVRTINPQARNEKLEQLLAQVRDLQARFEGKKTGISRGHPFSQHILDADLPQGFRELNILYDDKKAKSSGERGGSLKADREGRSRRWRPTQYTPLSAPQARILEVMEKEIHDNVVRWPQTRKDGPTNPKSNLYCRFHKDYGHNTDDSKHLKDEIERLIKAGHLKKFIYKDRERSSRRRERSRIPRKRARTPENEELPQKSVIHMIFGGPTDRDSNRARKAYSQGWHAKVEVQQVDEGGPVMNFGPKDVGEVEKPHNDALMITAQVSGYKVQIVFVDIGSSVNVIFYDCLKRMELDIELTSLHTSLFGFNGSKFTPLGETMLVVALREGDLRKVKMVRFVVVDLESAYN
ncbi:Unknown protein, partial [Striga hermonthica]